MFAGNLESSLIVAHDSECTKEDIEKVRIKVNHAHHTHTLYITGH